MLIRLKKNMFVSSLLFVGFVVPSTIGAFHASLPNRALLTRNDRNFENDGFMIFAISSQEAIDRMRLQREQDTAIMEQEQPPMLFDDDMLADMKAVILTLEKRVQEGPGSLTGIEINQLENRLIKIIDEMKVNEHMKPEKPKLKDIQELGGATVVEASAPPTLNVPSSYVQQLQQLQKQQELVGSNTAVSDTSEDEGPMYEGSGGMGQPRGTVNTYSIPGMEEMTSEEYLKALNDRVIETQRQRRQAGTLGKQSASSYLSSLNGQTGEGMFDNRKKNIGKKKDDNNKQE